MCKMQVCIGEFKDHHQEIFDVWWILKLYLTKSLIKYMHKLVKNDQIKLNFSIILFISYPLVYFSIFSLNFVN